MDPTIQLADVLKQLEEVQQQLAEQTKRAVNAEEQLRETTFSEFVRAYHEKVFTKLQVANRKSSTKGGTTNPRNKHCPTRLAPWSDFLEQQKKIFSDLLSIYPAENQAFDNFNSIDVMGKRVGRRRIGSEKALEYFQHYTVEAPVESIVEQFGSIEAVKNAFDLGDGILFENHANALSDDSEEVVSQREAIVERQNEERRARGEGEDQSGGQEKDQFDFVQLRPDQICIWRKDSKHPMQKTMLYVNEYKAPHKIWPTHFRVGLRPMDICEEVVNRATIPTKADPVGLFEYNADRLVAASVTQVYHYMIEGGLEYGVVTTGEVIVFLKLDWSNPTTLQYHLAEPAPEVAAHANDAIYCTAISQMLAFSLLAMVSAKSKPHRGQNERNAIRSQVCTWTEDVDSILRSIPEEDRKEPQIESPAYEPETYSSFNRSPYPIRNRNKSMKPPRDRAMPAARPRTPESSDDDNTGAPQGSPSSPTELRRSERLRGAQNSSAGQGRGRASEQSNSHQRPNQAYCTEKCLSGLTMQTELDEECPNIADHRRMGNGIHHDIGRSKVIALLRDQMQRTLDDGIIALYIGGARGVLFKVTLLTHGYTFIGKGTVVEFIEDLEREAKVYEALKPVQGINVPVFLGAVDLRPLDRIYYYEFRVRIRYIIFMSWGGESLDDDCSAVRKKALHRQLTRSIRAIHNCGVVHRDIRTPNVLVNRITGQLRIIDFERAFLIERPRVPLGSIVPNKRRLPTEETGAEMVEWKAKYHGGTNYDMGCVESVCEDIRNPRKDYY